MRLPLRFSLPLLASILGGGCGPLVYTTTTVDFPHTVVTVDEVLNLSSLTLVSDIYDVFAIFDFLHESQWETKKGIKGVSAQASFLYSAYAGFTARYEIVVAANADAAVQRRITKRMGGNTITAEGVKKDREGNFYFFPKHFPQERHLFKIAADLKKIVLIYDDFNIEFLRR